MSAKCKNYLPTFRSLVEFWSRTMDDATFKSTLMDAFEDGDSVYTKFRAGTLTGPGTDFSTDQTKLEEGPLKKVVTKPVTEVDWSGWYNGDTVASDNMVRNFRRAMIENAILKIDFNTSEFQVFPANDEVANGITVVNDKILQHKVKLINAIREYYHQEAIQPDNTMSDEKFTQLIGSTLNLVKSGDNLSSEVLDAYVTLSNYDKLIDSECSFIEIKPMYRNTSVDGINKYDYVGGSVKMFSSWGSEETDSMDQASDLAKIILDYIPEVINGRAIEGTSVGLAGFYTVMTAMKAALSYTSDPELYKLRQEIRKQGDKADFNKIIDAYINYLETQKDSSASDLYRRNVTYQIGKLRGLQKYIFVNQNSDSNLLADKVRKGLESMFKQMYVKNVEIEYRAYGYDSNLGRFAGKDLKSAPIDAQLYGLYDLISNTIYTLRTSEKLLNQFKNKWHFENNGPQITVESGNRKLIFAEIGSTKANTNFTAEDIKNLIHDLTRFNFDDSFDEIGAQIYQDWNTVNDLLPIAQIILSGITNNSIVPLKNNVPTKLSEYRNQLIRTAKVNSIISGSDISNVVKSVDRKKNLPGYGLTNLANDFQTIADKYNEIGEMSKDGLYNLFHNSFLVDTTTDSGEVVRSVYGGVSVRSDVLMNGLMKSPGQLTVAEVLTLATVKDFYESYKNKNEFIYLQNATFADKATHFLIKYRLAGLINGHSLREMIDQVITYGNSDLFTQAIFSTRSERINKLMENIIHDYAAAFIGERTIKTLDDIKTTIAEEGRDSIERHFADHHIKFDDEIHMSKNGFNETIENYYLTYNDRKRFDARMNRARKRFIKDLYENDVTWNRHDDSALESIYTDYTNWQGTNGNIKLAKIIKGGQEVVLNKYNLENELFTDDVEVQLHPVLEAFMMSDSLLSNEYNEMTIGGVYAHPNKDRNGANFGELSEFGEASRLIAQIKRSVVFGATMHPLTQGLANGVPDRIKIAVNSDLKAFVQNIVGDTSALDSMDGSGLRCGLEIRLENNSAIDAAGGPDAKTIGHDIDPFLNKPVTLKWAVYGITNERRRISRGSVVSLDTIQRKMYDLGLDKDVDLNKYIAKHDLYYEDYATGKYYKIVGGGFTSDGKAFQVRQEVKFDKGIEEAVGPKETRTLRGISKSLWGIDQILGGAWTGKWDGNHFIYNELSQDILAEIVTDNQELKNNYIAYVVNSSAIKVGAGNVNPQSSWTDNSPLRYIEMDTRHIGIQMDAEHHLEESDVTEMTQMISALIENGYTADLVNRIYEDIGSVVDEALSRYRDAVYAFDDGDRQKLYQILGETFIKSFEENDRDTLGLAQAFVRKASQSLKDGNIQYRIPFSAETVNGIFVSTVSSMITKKGIRRKYDGFAGVQTPSFNIIQFYRIGENGMLFKSMAKQIRDKYEGTNVTLGGKRLSKDNNFKLSNYRVVWAHPGIGKTTLAQTENSIIDFDSVYKKQINGMLGLPEGPDGHAIRVAWRNDHEGEWEQIIAQLFAKAKADAIAQNKTLLISDVSLLRDFNQDIDLIINTDLNTFNKWQKERKEEPNFEWKSSVDATFAYLYQNNLIGDKLLYTRRHLGDLMDISTVDLTIDGFFESNPYIHKLNLNERYSLDFEDTVICRNRSTGEMKEIKLSDFKTYDYIKHTNELYTGWDLYIHTAKPRNLKGTDTKFTVDGVRYSLYDLDSVRAAHYYAQGTNADFVNQVLIKNGFRPEEIKDVRGLLQHITQTTLRNLDKGRALGNVMSDANLAGKIATDVYVDPGEMIVGRANAKKMGIEPGVDYSEITSPEFFENRMRNDFRLTRFNGKNDLFDVEVFKRDDKSPILIKSISKDQVQKYVTENNLIKNNRYDSLNGYIYYDKNVRLFSSENKEVYAYTDEDGTVYDVILCTYDNETKNRSAAITDIINSSFVNYSRYNYTSKNFNWLKNIEYASSFRSRQLSIGTANFGNASVDDFIMQEELNHKAKIKNLAKRKYESFEIQKKMMATRIPSQSMQSFMPMKVVAFTDSEVNDQYLTPEKMRRDGSDFDIDKSYNLGYELDDYGILNVGTNLSQNDNFSLVELLELKTPTGIKFSRANSADGSDVATIVNYDLVRRIKYGTGKDRIDAINDILSRGKYKLRFEVPADTPTVRIDTEDVLSILNQHNTTVLRDSDKLAALRNRTAHHINGVTTNPQNQILAEIAIDTVTEGPKNAAKKTEMSGVQRHIMADNPATKLMMQVQNMVGREVIGIVAVSLKTFFAMSSYYNQKLGEVYNLIAEGKVNDAVDIIQRKIIKTNPLLGNHTTLANLNFIDLIELTNDNDVILSQPIVLNINPKYARTGDLTINYKNAQDEPITAVSIGSLNNLFKTLQVISNENDAALTDSALLSLATDNAKELALSKLNATSKLVDIYTYLLSLGTPFKTISDIMTSPMFNKVAKIAEGNMLRSINKSFDIKSALGFYLNQDYLPGIDPNVINYLLGVHNVSQSLSANKKAGLELLASGQFDVDTVLNGIQSKIQKAKSDQLAKLYSEYGDIDYDGMFDFWDDFVEKSRNFDTKPLTLLELRQAQQFFETWKDKEINKAWYAQRSDYAKTIDAFEKIMNKVLPGTEEMSIAGGTAGINQGLRTDPYQKYKFRERIENHINRRIEDHNKAMKSENLKINEKFDLTKALDPRNPEYLQRWINIMDDNDVVTTHNFLEILTEVPHFSKMLMAWWIDDAMLRRSSARFAIVDKFAHDIKRTPTIALRDVEYNQVKRYVSDIFIMNWLVNSGIQFNIPAGSEAYVNYKLKPVEEDTNRISLNSQHATATFKHWVETYVIPRLYEIYDGDQNVFLRELMPYRVSLPNGQFRTIYKLSTPMMDIDKSQKLKIIYNNIVDDFKKIAQDTFEGDMKIGDIFYLYNLIVNKDSFGQNTMTRLFESLVNMGEANFLIEDFYSYMANLDAIGDVNTVLSKLQYNLNDLKTRIADHVSDTKIEASKSKVACDTNDYTFELWDFFKVPTNLNDFAPNVTFNHDPNDEFFDNPSGGGVIDIDLIEQNGIKATMPTYVYLQYMLGQIIDPGIDENDNVQYVTDDDWQDLIENGMPYYPWDPAFVQYVQEHGAFAKNQKAFIFNGKFYFTDKANIGDGFHEFAHVLLAKLKWSDDPKQRELYYKVVAAVQDDPHFEDIAKHYPHAIGADLQEEVFANLLGMYLNNQVFTDDKVLKMLGKPGQSINSLVDSILRSHTPKDVPLYELTLGTFLELYGPNNIQNLFREDPPEYILRTHQQIADLKSKLYEADLLKVEC